MPSPPPTEAHHTRVVKLTGGDNVRDLGGLPAAGGMQTRRGRVFRAELLPQLTDADVDLLVRELGLRSVVDLRTRGEIRHTPGIWVEHGVAWINAPFRLVRTAPVPGPRADYVAAYLGFLEGGPERIALAIEAVMDPGNGPVLFHCAAGKDLLGVPREVIAEDYALTAQGLPRVFARLVGLEPYRRMLRDEVAADHMPLADTMVRFLEELDRRHGGTEKWLTGHGVDHSRIERFRRTMLVAADPDTR